MRPLTLTLPSLLLLNPTTLALPQQQPLLPANQPPPIPFAAQRPLHTTALLAGAAAKATPTSNPRDPRIRDLRTLTGESGLWVSLDDLRRGKEGGDADRYWEEKAVEGAEKIRKREGWAVGGGEV